MQAFLTSALDLVNDKLHDPANLLSGIALGYGMDDRGFEYLEVLGIFIFATVNRPTLGPIQISTQWIAGALS
jgi:hypothetical protein